MELVGMPKEMKNRIEMHNRTYAIRKKMRMMLDDTLTSSYQMIMGSNTYKALYDEANVFSMTKKKKRRE